MRAAGWLSRSLADVPADDAGWLGSHEREVLADLRIARRRADWRLGRWTAKQAVAVWLGLDPRDVEIVAAGDGAPEAYEHGRPLPVSVSLSHRAGRAIAVVADVPASVGCDIERAEPRSPAFVREWLGDAERAAVAAAGPGGYVLEANLVWSAKEAGAKVRRQGLRLDVRRARVLLQHGGDGDWAPLRVTWASADGGGATAGWWRADDGWIVTIAAEPSLAAPVALDARAQ